MPLKIRYKPFLWLSIGGMGISQLVLGFTRFTRGSDPTTQFLLGIVGIGLAALMYAIPFAVIELDRIVLNGLLGLVKRNYLFKSLNDLKLEADQLHLVADGQWKAAGVMKQVAHPDDWKALEKLLASARNP